MKWHLGMISAIPTKTVDGEIGVGHLHGELFSNPHGSKLEFNIYPSRETVDAWNALAKELSSDIAMGFVGIAE